jgi:HAD superfamily hydrolase (TIGR01509 family)
MNKAFIFDFDGVIINSETVWEEEKKKFYPEVVGEEIAKKLVGTIGSTIDGIYKNAVQYGATISREAFLEAFYKRAVIIYQTAPITPGLQKLTNTLHQAEYLVGIVTSSPKEWVEIVFNRAPYLKTDFILSLHAHQELQPKPSPDGYREAMRELNVSAENTIVLEDSNAGISSAKASGAYTIGLKQNLVKDYTQEGADIYADTLKDVIKLLLSKQ